MKDKQVLLPMSKSWGPPLKDIYFGDIRHVAEVRVHKKGGTHYQHKLIQFGLLSWILELYVMLTALTVSVASVNGIQ